MEHGTSRPENRGGIRVNEDMVGNKDAICDHIKMFTCRASQYTRRGAPSRKYLPSDLNVRRMHELFLGSAVSQKSDLIATISFLVCSIVDNLRCLDQEREEKDLGKEARNVTEKTISFYSTSSSPEKENSSSNRLGTPPRRGG